MAQRPQMQQDIATARFRLDDLDNTAHLMSIPTLWERSYLCPCRHRQTRQPNPVCPVCHGRGIAYKPPHDKDIIIQSQEKGVVNTDIGLMDSGTAIGTPAYRYEKISFRDRITVPSVQIPQSFIFDVTERRVNTGFFMVYDVRDVEYVISMDIEKDTYPKELVEGEDFTVDYDKNIFYPDESLLYNNISLNISTTLRYMVADLLKEHRYMTRRDGSLEPLQQKLLLKREDIFIDKESFELGVDKEEVNEMVDTKRKPAPDGLNGFFR